MVKKKKKPRTDDFTIGVRLPTNLGAALNAFIAAQRPEIKVKAAVVCAIEDYLKAQGYWPVPQSNPEAERNAPNVHDQD